MIENDDFHEQMLEIVEKLKSSKDLDKQSIVNLFGMLFESVDELYLSLMETIENVGKLAKYQKKLICESDSNELEMKEAKSTIERCGYYI